jgi:D-alanyl-D-alanine carboxypeptidase
MILRISLVISLLLASLPGSVLRAQEAPLQAVLDSARVAMAIPGAAAAVVFPDGTAWEGAGGMAGPAAPATPGTAFELGSISKLYTAAALLRLVEEGRLALDDRLACWFPELAGAGSITVRQLLSHTHGLHDPLQEPDFIPAVLENPGRSWALADVLSRMRDPEFEPGAGWRYSNTGFHLLGAIAEKVTGSPFGEVLRARLFAPLELGHTWYGPDDPEGVALAAAYIDPSGSGHPQPVSLLMPWTAFRTSAGPAGAVVATAPDAARFLHALVTGTVLGEGQWKEMTSWVVRPDGNRYGLGVLRIEEEGGPLLGHKGNSAGYSASVFHDPSRGITVAVLTNAHAVDVTPVALALLRAAIPLDPSSP